MVAGGVGRVALGFAAVCTVMCSVAALAGCDAATPSGRTEDQHACGPLAADDPVVHEPNVVAVDGDGREALPHRWNDAPTAEDVLAAARSGSRRAEAERFAWLVVQRILDTRDEVDGQRLVDAVAAPELPEEACLHLVGRPAGMYALGWGSYVSSRFPVFHRSRTVGDDAAPSRVELEVIAVVELENDPHFFGDTSESELEMRIRVDVVREGDVWLLADWAGPEAAAVRDGKPARAYGTGWNLWDPSA